MKHINEIDPKNYGCFYYSQLKGDVKISLISPDGNIEYFDYEAFYDELGTVIAFNDFNPQSTDYAYLLECDGKEELIQFQLYENLENIFNNDDSTDNSYYAFFGSKSVVVRASKGEHLFVPLEEHCDKHIYGPAPFFELQDGVNDTIIDFSTLADGNLKRTVAILAVQGEACILRVELNNENGSYRNYPSVSAISKTLVGLLRMACEWRAMTKEPFNNTEFPALKMSNFLDKIGIDEEVENALRIAQGPMHVEKFITDPNNARQPIEETAIFPSELLEVLTPQLRYRSLSSLSKNTIFVADESLLNKEKTTIESDIFSFFTLNNIDSTAFGSVDEIISHLKTISHYSIDSQYIDIYDLLEKIKSL